MLWETFIYLKGELINMTRVWESESASAMCYVRLWFRFLSGTQIFSLSHACVTLINSPFTFITKLKNLLSLFTYNLFIFFI